MDKLYINLRSISKYENRKYLQKKNYKTYFWLLKTYINFKSFNSDKVKRFAFLHLSKRLDIILYQKNFSLSVKRSRFIIKVLKVFQTNKVDLKIENIGNLLVKECILTVKIFFLKSQLKNLESNLKIRNVKRKKSSWVLKHSYHTHSQFSYINKLKNLYFERVKNINCPKINKTILLDTKSLNLLLL